MNKILLLASATLGFAALSSANLVVNGDFSLTVPNVGFGNGWTGTLNDGAGGWRATGGNPDGTYIINSNGSTSSNPSLAQDITGLVVGATYVVSGDYARGNIGGGTDKDFGVTIDGNTWEYTVPSSDTDFAHFSEHFVATSSSVTLLLEAERHGDHDARVDNISLELESVPEPATMAVLGLGALALRRRKKA
ncbi:MAG: PEP-CTERM sorting domain-containing protein [Fimbriimonadaceae bacterium]|nr:PEP-CTERM sorting domain-containing protein [Fimbriimonadaceae bacterium]